MGGDDGTRIGSSRNPSPCTPPPLPLKKSIPRGAGLRNNREHVGTGWRTSRVGVAVFDKPRSRVRNVWSGGCVWREDGGIEVGCQDWRMGGYGERRVPVGTPEEHPIAPSSQKIQLRR